MSLKKTKFLKFYFIYPLIEKLQYINISVQKLLRTREQQFFPLCNLHLFEFTKYFFNIDIEYFFFRRKKRN